MSRFLWSFASSSKGFEQREGRLRYLEAWAIISPTSSHDDHLREGVAHFLIRLPAKGLRCKEGGGGCPVASYIWNTRLQLTNTCTSLSLRWHEHYRDSSKGVKQGGEVPAPRWK